MLKNQLGKIIMLTSLEMEKELIKKLREKINIRPLNPISFFRHPKKDPPVIIKNLGMLLQEGNRSKAYIQALVNSGLYPNFVLILKDPHHKDNLDTIPNERASNLFDPNISEIKVLKEAGIPYKLIIASSCDSPESIEELKSRPEEFFVFSGRGILNDVLKIGKELIHVHSGKLPDYRGSTCHFYSVLAGEGWWCTSFIMDLSVDQGEIITNREFSLPGKDIDDARIYDPYTRSMVLVDTIKQLAETGSLKTIPQDISKGIDYYIIHPVLGFIRRKFLDRFE